MPNNELPQNGKYQHQKKYFQSDNGKFALKRARDAYDYRDIERRRKQKRDYMRRKRKGVA